jgi:hypothetical protein
MRLMDLHGEGPGYVGCCSDVLRQRKIAPSPTLVCCDLPLPVCRHASAACTHPQPIFRLVSACLSCACSLHTIIRTCSGVRLGAQFGFRLSTWLGTGLGFDWRRHQGRVRHRALHASVAISGTASGAGSAQTQVWVWHQAQRRALSQTLLHDQALPRLLT